jgi:SAM-dependent methyltransferase
VDLLVDEQDGLGACRHYDLPFVCVEADFDALPLAPGQFDAVVFNGSLHYAPDAAATLDHAHAMLRPGGVLAVVDSPMFARERDGQAMRRRLCDRLREDYDITDPVHPGQGFLTFDGMAAWAAGHARRSAFLPSESGWRPWLRRRALARALGRGLSPEFGVWVST